MATMRRRNLLASRRRVDDEGEEDDGLLGAGDDSASEASVLTDAEDNPEIDDSELSDTGNASSPEVVQSRMATIVPVALVVHGTDSGVSEVPKFLIEPTGRSLGQSFHNTADTEAMMHGLKLNEHPEEVEVVNFEDAISPLPQGSGTSIVPQTSREAASTKRESMIQRRMRESQEYNSKRESDPAFVPTRGGFFMHDHRNDVFGQPLLAPSGRGRGRGRDIVVNAHSSSRPNIQSWEASKGRWNHDLHDAITTFQPVVEPKPAPRQESHSERSQLPGMTAQILSPSRSVPLGVVRVKIQLPLTEVPLKTVKMTVNQHTRLPDLRPPLRRDKPVRVSLPNASPRYIFPSIDRSFVFIPRAQRPNQQANKIKSRPFGAQSISRRTSAHGDSGYEPSIAMSRRSSVAQDAAIFSQTPLSPGQSQGAVAGSGRPVVKLPSGQGEEPDPLVPAFSATPYAQNQIYELPSLPTYREASIPQLPMHQPRPQKTVSVATIESPDNALLHAPQQQAQQPFHHQVPVNINGQLSVESGGTGSHMSLNHQGVRSSSTSNIPDGAINAQPFQPSTTNPQAIYPVTYPPQPMYYYGAQTDARPDQYTVDNVSSSIFVQQGPYLVPMYAVDETAAATQPGTFAQERNGMVYYYDSSQMVSGNDEVAPGGYAIPSNGNMLPPGSESYYYAQPPTNAVYYP